MGSYCPCVRGGGAERGGILIKIMVSGEGWNSCCGHDRVSAKNGMKIGGLQTCVLDSAIKNGSKDGA